MTPTAAFRRSSRCDTASCVEVATTGAAAFMRDSKNPHSPVLPFARDGWNDFLAGVRAGEFDRPPNPPIPS